MALGIGARFVIVIASFAAFTPLAGASTWFVRADAPPGGRGTTWASAFDTLQAGLAAANASDHVWVKAGTYRPGTSSSPRTVTFLMKSGVAVYGGFTGVETALAQRDYVAHSTVLSGDLLQDDGPHFTNREDNVYHVVSAFGVAASAVLDGFVVSGGNADGSSGFQAQGGGVIGANATLRHLSFVDNEAIGGGALGLPEGAWNPAPIAQCTFRGNRASVGGGAISCNVYALTLRQCIFGGNSAPVGGAIYYELGSQGPGTIEDCVIAGNSASTTGGGIRSAWCMLDVVNSVIAYNNSSSGTGGMTGGGQPFAAVTLENSIVWGNTSGGISDAYLKQLGSAILVSDTAVQGGSAPLNVDPRWTHPSGGDGIFGTGDDDFTLSCVSPYIDYGSNASASGIVTDLAGNPRFADDPATPDLGTGTAPIVDLGPYEFTCACNAVANFCTPVPNASGLPALLSWSGSTSLFANALTFHVMQGPPNKNGLFFYGALTTSVPFGDGIRCVGGSLYRLSILTLDAGGAASFDFDVTQPPASSGPGQVLEGSNWNFQFYFRDPLGGPAGWNASDALSVKFCR